MELVCIILLQVHVGMISTKGIDFFVACFVVSIVATFFSLTVLRKFRLVYTEITPTFYKLLLSMIGSDQLKKNKMDILQKFKSLSILQNKEKLLLKKINMSH